MGGQVNHVQQARMGLMVRCLHNFGPIVYSINIRLNLTTQKASWVCLSMKKEILSSSVTTDQAYDLSRDWGGLYSKLWA